MMMFWHSKKTTSVGIAAIRMEAKTVEEFDCC
jgi:hypothetical protein